MMVNEAKILPSRSYELPVFTVELTIKPSAIIKFNYNTCYFSALCVLIHLIRAGTCGLSS